MKQRRPMFAGNWKMNLDLSSATLLARQLHQLLARCRHADVVVFPPSPLIAAVGRTLQESPIAFGAQDMSPHPQGAFTGDISATMLKSLGCTHVLVGHSERRQHHLESDQDVRDKLVAALQAGLRPILCIGERLGERESGQTLMRIERQVRAGLEGVDAEGMDSVVMAYEPVWAIGTGRVATPAQAEEVHEAIRGLLERLYHSGIAEKTRILYGGSVTADNAKALMEQKDVDGALVGGASLSAESFAGIVFNQE